ncbi:hypothetical protein HWV62_40677 [Athelia sp. TMB]|nr:hypothetical protein HWV62_40677 [Athelia sp. TMB]
MDFRGQDTGANAPLRTLFFRVAQLAKLPILPLFMFDGRQRPAVKRGSKMGKAGSHGLSPSFKQVLGAFGFEWREAPGEAEAELAYLNKCGVIDAIMTDDVDTLLFGATTIIKNISKKLTGNKAHPALDSAGKANGTHVMVYSAESIRTHPQVRLTQGGMVLIALLAGGDYGKGVEKCGKDIAYAMALCGFGEQLVSLYDRRKREDIYPALANWRRAVNEELHTNSRKHMKQRHPSIFIPNTFPDMQIMEFYMNPVCSSQARGPGGGPIKCNGEMNLAKLAAICESNFEEWGYMTAIIKRFRGVIWPGAVVRLLRRAAVESDEKETDRRHAAGNQEWASAPVGVPVLRPEMPDAVGTPALRVRWWLGMTETDRMHNAFAHNRPGGNASEHDPHPLIVEIVKSREHVSADGMREYQVVICPIQLVALARSGVRGIRTDLGLGVDFPEDADDGDEETRPKKRGKKLPEAPESNTKIWLPASLIQHVHPRLVAEFEAAEVTKAKKKAGKGKGKAKNISEDCSSDVDMPSLPPKVAPKRKGISKAGAAQHQAFENSFSGHTFADAQAGFTPQPYVHAPARAPVRSASPPKALAVTDVSKRHLPSDYKSKDAPTMPAPTASLLDPWFTDDWNQTRYSGIGPLSALFLWSPNPDEPSCLSEEAEDPRDQERDDEEKLLMDMENAPRTRFDHVFDQIMGISKRVPQRKKATSAKRKSGPETTTRERAPRPAKKARPSSSAIHTTTPARTIIDPAKAAPKLVYLDSDDEDAHPFASQFTASSRTPPTSPPAQRAARSVARKEHMPVASSSRGGGDFLADADMFFDLT